MIRHVCTVCPGLLPLPLVAWALPATAQADARLPDRYDLERPVARYELPGRLREVSGLAFTPQGVLLAHADERAVVYRIDKETGGVDRGFTLGDKGVRGDFEAVAMAGERLFLVTSAGVLYESRLAPEGGSSPYRVTDLGLRGSCEVEGMAYVEEVDQLLLACKVVHRGASELRIHRVPVALGAPAVAPLRVPFSSFVPFGLDDGVHASGIDVDPATGHLVLVAAREEALLEIDLDGRVVWAARLGRSRHRQPEGIAFGPDGLLYVSDEANGRSARLTVYGPREASVAR